MPLFLPGFSSSQFFRATVSFILKYFYMYSNIDRIGTKVFLPHESLYRVEYFRVFAEKKIIINIISAKFETLTSIAFLIIFN